MMNDVFSPFRADIELLFTSLLCLLKGGSDDPAVAPTSQLS